MTPFWLPIYIWPPRDADPVTISFETYGTEVRFDVPRSEIVVTLGSGGVGGRLRVLASGGDAFVEITIASTCGPRVETLPRTRLSEHAAT